MSYSTSAVERVPAAAGIGEKVTRVQRLQWPFRVNQSNATPTAQISVEAKEVIQTTARHWAAASKT